MCYSFHLIVLSVVPIYHHLRYLFYSVPLSSFVPTLQYILLLLPGWLFHCQHILRFSILSLVSIRVVHSHKVRSVSIIVYGFRLCTKSVPGLWDSGPTDLVSLIHSSSFHYPVILLQHENNTCSFLRWLWHFLNEADNTSRSSPFFSSLWSILR